MLKFFFCFIIIFTSSCNQSQDTSKLDIIGGSTNFPPLHPGLTSIVAITTNRTTNFEKQECTGVIIAPTIILTAAHCLVSVESANQVQIVFAKNGFIEARIKAQEFLVHPKYFSIHGKNGNETFNSYDLAWIRLSSNIPSGYTSLKILSDTNMLEAESELDVIGFGVSNELNLAMRLFEQQYTTLKMNEFIDDPSFVAQLKLVPKTPMSGTCFGDSGGPVVIKHNEEWIIAGITSGSNAILFDQAGCGKGLIATFPGSYIDWLTDTSKINFSTFGEVEVRQEQATWNENLNPSQNYTDLCNKNLQNINYEETLMRNTILAWTGQRNCYLALNKLLDADLSPVFQVAHAIFDFSWLHELNPNLLSFFIAGREHLTYQFRSLSHLRLFSQLESLTLMQVGLNDQNASHLGNIEQLNYINLAQNYLTQTNFLAGNNKLISANLDNNQIIEIEKLEDLSNIKFLFIRENPITKFECPFKIKPYLCKFWKNS